MEYLFVVLLLVSNFVISWSNASSVGRYWSESKVIGGSFRRLVVCGYVMAISGFTMVYGYILILIAPYILNYYEVSQEIVATVVKISDDLLYLLIAVPVILSGFRIWIASLRTFWQEKTIGHFVLAGWNSYAQISNTINYARNAPSAAGRIFKALLGGDSKKRSNKDNSTIILAVLAIIIFAFFGGYFTADAIMKKADAKYDAFADAYDRYKADSN